MTLTSDERNTIIAHRLQRAFETFTEADDLIRLKHWHGAANRLYYACYYAATALLIKHGHITKTHGGVIGLSGKYFVQTGLISKEDNKLYVNLFNMRQEGNYGDWIQIDEEDIKPLLEPAKAFISTIEKLIEE
jgi:uncharacterized protein (UPF0332 family)